MRKEWARQRRRALVAQAAQQPEMLFWKQADWIALKEEFFTEIATDGAYRYKTVKEFFAEKFKHDVRAQRWARLVTGRSVPKSIPWEGNWELERYREHWQEDRRVRKIAEVVEQELDAATVAYATAPLFVEQIGRIHRMQQEVDEQFRGRLYLDGLSETENQKRAGRYLALTARLQEMMTQAIIGAQEATGGRKMMVVGMMERYLRRATERRDGQPDKETAAVEELCQRIARMTLERSKIYQQRPEELEEVFQMADAAEQKQTQEKQLEAAEVVTEEQ